MTKLPPGISISGSARAADTEIRKYPKKITAAVRVRIIAGARV
jgi:hypothetical protein